MHPLPPNAISFLLLYFFQCSLHYLITFSSSFAISIIVFLLGTMDFKIQFGTFLENLAVPNLMVHGRIWCFHILQCHGEIKAESTKYSGLSIDGRPYKMDHVVLL